MRPFGRRRPNDLFNHATAKFIVEALLSWNIAKERMEQ
jgi:hypothetical protein